MRVGLVKPPNSGSLVRGVGFYAERLKSGLEKLPEVTVEWVDFSPNPLSYKSFDLIHYPYFDITFPTFTPVIGKKVVVTVHDLIPLRFPKAFPLGKRGKVIWPLQKALLKTASAVITDSHASKEDIGKFTSYSLKNIYPIHLAADPAFKVITDKKFLSNVKKKYDLPDKFVFYVGGVNWNKNLPVLAKACLEGNYNLVIAGKEALGEKISVKHVESESFNEFIDLMGQSPLLHRLGFVPTDELVALYNLATVHVQPSIYEGFGLPVLEAMACGCPEICGRNSSIEEIAGEAALYTDITSSQAIASKIEEVFTLNAKERQKVTQQGLKQAQKFSWEKTAKETLNVYQMVLK